MATYNWSTLINGQHLTFDPAVDVLHFDILVYAAQLQVGPASASTTSLTFDGKTVALEAEPDTLPVSSITFAFGSILMIGDGTIISDDGSDTLNGSSGNDQLISDRGTNRLNGAEGNDVLFAGDPVFSFSDTLDGGGGVDTMTGGTGSDTYIVDDIGDIVNELANGGSSDTIVSSVGFILPSFVEHLVLTGSIDAGGTGNDLANQITGNSGNNVLDGGSGIGNDLLTGGVGNDTLYGGSGTDTLDGGAGEDVLIGGNQGDFYVVDEFDLVVEDNVSGTDTVQAGISYSLGANLEILSLVGSASISGSGNELANRLTGNAAGNLLEGGAGADTLNGGIGADTLAGGTESDIYFVDDAGDLVLENPGEGTDAVVSTLSYQLTPNLENLTLSGTTNINGTGNASANIITGNGGNNILDGGTEADFLAGGAGDDTYIVDSAGDVVSDASDGGTDLVKSSVSYELDDFSRVENLTLTGSSAINGTGSTFSNVITGNDANNRLDGGAGDDTLIGGSGNDTIEGGEGVDSLNGGAGDDVYVVDASTDAVADSSGSADLVLSSVSYVLGADVERLELTGLAISGIGNSSSNIITGNDESNALSGGAGNDTLSGGEGNDTLDGGAGVDSLSGGAGDDTYIVDLSTDVVVDSSGTADLVRSLVSYTLGTGIERLELLGVTLNGIGNSANNVITGNGANNVLNGGAGADTLIGGQGLDIYVVDNLFDVVIDNAGSADSVQSSVSYALGSDIENLTLTGSLSINGTGNESSNFITGNSGDNTLKGEDGADTLTGGAGVDVLWGGDGDDTFIIDSLDDSILEFADELGVDTVYSSVGCFLPANSVIENIVLTGVAAINAGGGSLANVLIGNIASNDLNGGDGNDTLDGGTGNDTIDGDGGNDSLNGGAGADKLAGGVGNDLFDGGSGSDTIYGEQGNDYLVGGTGNDHLDGYTGNNTLDGGVGDDTMYGGDGNDTYFLDSDGDQIFDSGGTDTLYSPLDFYLNNIENLYLTGTAVTGVGTGAANLLAGNAVANFLDGADGNDTLDGDSGNDTLLGGAGNDSIDGGSGADSMVGGTGNDIYHVNTASDDVLEVAGQGTDTIKTTISFSLAGLQVERLTLLGSVLNGTGNSLDNLVTGNSSDNLLKGLTGDDTLDGNAGADTMIGSTGNDNYEVDSAGDVVTEIAGEGTDIVRSSITIAALADEVENLTLTGSDAINGTGNVLANYITGNAAANTLKGGGGVDTLAGGDGNDTYNAVASDVIIENTGEGTDEVRIAGSYILGSNSNIENLTLTGTGAYYGTGNSLANEITGNSGANTLDGGAGADTLSGGDGNDTFIGGSGTDVVLGGAGNDVFFYDSSSEFGLDDLDGGSGTDTLLLDCNSAAGYSISLTPGRFTGIEVVELADGPAGPANVEAYLLTTALTMISSDFGGVMTGTMAGDTMVGKSNTDYLLGDGGNDSIDGGGGDDGLEGGLGVDTVRGGSGDDYIEIYDYVNGEVIDGGTGNDILDVYDQVLNLTVIPNVSLTGIENIGLQSSTLTLNASEVLALSATSDTLFVFAYDSAINGDTGWTKTANVTVQGLIYDRYTKSGATIYLSDDSTATVSLV